MKQIVNQVAKVTLLKQDRFQSNVQQFEGTAKATITFNLSKGLTRSLTMKLNSEDPLLLATAGGTVRVDIQNVAPFKAYVHQFQISGSTAEISISLIEHDTLRIALKSDPPTDKQLRVKSAVFGIVSYIKLGSSVHSAGIAVHGDPFSLIKKPDSSWPNEGETRSTSTMQFIRGDVSCTLVPGDEDWESFVDDSLKQHVFVVGIRRRNDESLLYDEIQAFKSLMSAFISWINGCQIPVFATKYYCDNKTILLELPSRCNLSAPNRYVTFYPDTVTGISNIEDIRKIGQQLWEGFSNSFEDSKRGESIQNALNILHNHAVHEYGVMSSFFRLTSLWECSQILYKVASNKEPRSSRPKIVLDILNMLDISKEVRMHLTNTLKDHDEVIESNFGTSQIHDIFGNLVSKLVHAGESANMDLLEKVNPHTRERLVVFQMWIIDLLMLKITNYNSLYVNRLTGADELVPWKNNLECF